MIYGSVCSGIEAATVAWHPLGWTPAFFSEIDAYPRALLSHHYPEVPLHGDFTTIQGGDYRPIDLLVGGTPCQSFSIAGLRGGLDDDRGNLALEFLRLADRLRPTWVVWENVPGVLSSNGGRDFGAFLGGLGELGYGWSYRVLDAQYFNLAQRRARVFVVGCLGDWRGPAAVLFEPQSLSGDPAPSRSAGKGTTVDAAPSLTASGRSVSRTGESRGQDPAVGVVATLDANYGRLQGCSGQDANHGHSHLIAFGGNNTQGPIEISTAVQAHGSYHGDFECETFVAVVGFNWQNGGGYGNANDGLGITEEGTGPLSRSQVPAVAQAVCATGEVFHTLRADGFDASKDGTGRGAGAVVIGTPLYECKACGESFADPYATGVGGLAPAECPRCGEERGVVQAVAFQQNTRDEVRLIGGDGQIVGALAADSGMKQTNYVARPEPGQIVEAPMQVRRLTPTECERLQGFPDGYTLVPYRGKPAADGPRYKGIGNSMAVPVMAWIGRRIDIVDKIMRGS